MKKILIVDDEADLCFLLKKNLEEVGDFVVSTCSESSKAIEQARAFRPDLILLDVLMPGISGPELVEQLKVARETKEIPVVFLTAIATEEETGERKNVIGGQYMLAKPVEMEELLQVIQTATHRRAA